MCPVRPEDIIRPGVLTAHPLRLEAGLARPPVGDSSHHPAAAAVLVLLPAEAVSPPAALALPAAAAVLDLRPAAVALALAAVPAEAVSEANKILQKAKPLALPLFFFATTVKVTIVLTVKYNKNKHGAAVF